MVMLVMHVCASGGKYHRYINCLVVLKPTRSSTFVGAFLSRRAHTYTAAAGCGGHSMRPSDPWHFDWDPQFLQSEQGDKGSDLERKITQSER